MMWIHNLKKIKMKLNNEHKKEKQDLRVATSKTLPHFSFSNPFFPCSFYPLGTLPFFLPKMAALPFPFSFRKTNPCAFFLMAIYSQMKSEGDVGAWEQREQ